MKSTTKKILIGATLLAIALLVLCSFASAYITSDTRTTSSFKSSQSKYSNQKVPYDTRTSVQKYYYSYAPAVDKSSFRYKQVYNAVDYKNENNYSYSYYYAPRYNSNTQTYNWRF